MDVLKIIGRKSELFSKDLLNYNEELNELIQNNRFLILGGGGAIGQAVTKELYSRQAKCLHVVDLSENYLVELIRDIRSSFENQLGSFEIFPIDCGSSEFEAFIEQGKYDYVLNLSAMKHVRSENHPFSMYRMLEVNILNTINTYNWAGANGAKHYFCVSTDKAANPANFMGATKRAMELCVMRPNGGIPINSARFANVAFSNGSLLDGFQNRVSKHQPLSLPYDIRRFFITSNEAGIICVMATLLGEKNRIYFPNSRSEIQLNDFKEIAKNFLIHLGKKPVFFETEHEARENINILDLDKYWPVNIFATDTVGEKPFEEFFTEEEDVLIDKFDQLASVEFISPKSSEEVHKFLDKMRNVNLTDDAAVENMLSIMKSFVTTFQHVKGERTLNSRM